MRFAPGSGRLAAVPAIVAVAFLPFLWPASAALLCVAAFVLVFHRDPERSIPEASVVAPADGTVSVLREDGERVRLGIYMSARDVHVNRAPMAGTVESIEHEPGGHRLAFQKESEHNERLRTSFDDFEVVQIAGAFARRTHSYLTSGEEVERGDRIGHISFSSRVDLLFPPAYDLADIAVETGDSVQAGETIVAPGRANVTDSESEHEGRTVNTSADIAEIGH